MLMRNFIEVFLQQIKNNCTMFRFWRDLRSWGPGGPRVERPWGFMGSEVLEVPGYRCPMGPGGPRGLVGPRSTRGPEGPRGPGGRRDPRTGSHFLPCPAKINKFRTRLIFWILIQLISLSEKKKAVEQSWKEKYGKLFFVHLKTWKAFSSNNTILANFYFYSSCCYFFMSKYF